MALTMDTVASVNGLTVTTTQGYTLTRIGNKSLRKGDTIYTDGKYVYGMEGNGGKQLPMLPSVNYLFFNPYSTDTMKPGIYGFYKSFSKPVFVCDTNNDIFLLFMGRHSAYSEFGDSYTSLSGSKLPFYEVGKNNKQIESTYYDPNDDSITVYHNGISQYNLDTCVGNDGNLYELQHVEFNQVPTHVYGEDGGYTTGEDLAGVVLYKNGEVYEKKPLEEWYYNNFSHLHLMPWAHIREDGTYQCLYLCDFNGDSKTVDDYPEFKSELPIITKTKRFTFPEGMVDGEKYYIYKRTSEPNHHGWSDKNLVFSSSKLEDIYSFVDGDFNPFGNIWFYDYDFISYVEYKIFLYDSRKKAKEAKTYWLLRNSRLSKSLGSLELSDNSKLKESGCTSVSFYIDSGFKNLSTGIDFQENAVSYFFKSNKNYQYIFRSLPYDPKMPGDTSKTEIVHSGDTDIDVEIGTDSKGSPINMTLAIHNGWVHQYKCLGYELDVPVREAQGFESFIDDTYIGDLVSHGYEIKSVEQIDSNRYLLLTTEGVILINKKTGECKNIYPTPFQDDRESDGWIKYRESLCKYNTRLLKSDSIVKNRIKKNLRGGD